MPSSTVENYLKQIYLAQREVGLAPGSSGEVVAMGDLARAMSVVPGTATAMVKTLADAGLVAYEPRTGVRLTPQGRQLALHVIRRHRLVELFLVQVLKLDWSEVHAEAEQWEHVISDKVLQRMDEYLGSPKVDPHGDPIPTAKGSLHDAPLASLADCGLDQPMRVARVVDQNPAFLQFAERLGLTPGSALEVKQRDAHADSVTVRLARSRQPVTLGTAAAEKILVESVSLDGRDTGAK